MRAIVTVVGKDRVGIIAGVSRVLAESNVNILDISQTVLQEEYFTMIMLVDLSGLTPPFARLMEHLTETGNSLGVAITVQREEIFQSMHNV
jgi:ACT domain-containing protein